MQFLKWWFLQASKKEKGCKTLQLISGNDNRRCCANIKCQGSVLNCGILDTTIMMLKSYSIHNNDLSKKKVNFQKDWTFLQNNGAKLSSTGKSSSSFCFALEILPLHPSHCPGIMWCWVEGFHQQEMKTLSHLLQLLCNLFLNLKLQHDL